MEIKHYGVKGMKWKNRKPIINPENMDRISRLRLMRTGKDFVISKKSNLYRATNSLTEKRGRLYVSALLSDGKSYAGEMDSIGGTYKKDIHFKTYSLTKNMKVAGTKVQVKELLKASGQKELAKTINDKTTDEEMYNILHPKDQNKELNLDILNKDTRERAMFINNMSKKGYDAVYDLVDGAQMGYRELPMVVLDSGKNIVEKQSKKIWDADIGWINN